MCAVGIAACEMLNSGSSLGGIQVDGEHECNITSDILPQEYVAYTTIIERCVLVCMLHNVVKQLFLAGRTNHQSNFCIWSLTPTSRKMSDQRYLR